MSQVWRITTSLHPPLDGEGARLFGGRWNSMGVPMVYASEHLSLAVLEVLVHLDTEELPDTLLAYRVEIPDDSVLTIEPDVREGAASEDDAAKSARARGDAWADSLDSLALAVPSVIVPEERNVLLNPRHPRMAEVQVRSMREFTFDQRLLR